MQIPVSVTQLTSAPKALTNSMPMVTMSCMQDPRAPRMEVSAVSEMYTGAASAKAPPPNPVPDSHTLLFEACLYK